MLKLTEQELKKLMNNFMKSSRIDTKEENCVLCGKKLTKTCSSHSVPKFVLENVSDSGIVYKPYGFDEISEAMLKQKLGLNEAGTFRSVCLECDSRWFSSYENESSLLNFNKLNKTEKTKILAQIYLKSSLLKNTQKKQMLL